MNLWQTIKQWLDPAAGTPESMFSLGDRGEKPGAEAGARLLIDTQIRTEGLLTHIDSVLEAQPQGKEALDKAGDLTDSLDENLKRLKKLFRMPANQDLIIREFLLASQPPTRAAACFMEGLSDKVVINGHILEPLMLLAHLDHHVDGEGEAGTTQFSIETVVQRLLPGHQTSEKTDFASIAEVLLAGDTVLLFDGAKTAIDIETKAPPGRSVSDAKQEQVVQGAKDAFVEAWRVNVALVRRRLKDPRVVTEILTVGEVSRNYVGLMYIDGIVTPKLVAEVKRRVEAINVDVMNSSGVLEQFIEDAPRSLFPGALTTERPDRTAAYLAEGNVALLADNTPYALIAPITFWSLLQTPEDYYLRWPFGAFIRYIRLFALVIATVTPALYLSVVNYHHEMIPTELMLFIASSRENVPLPAIAELLVMDVVFEMIRESGVRIPNVIGPTIGLVSSLVLGQAAVEAKLISPLVIMIVAVTGLASFAIPNYLTSFAIRSLRFLLLFAAMLMGFYGVAVGIFLIVIYLSGTRSFGVPYLSPVAPLRPLTADALTRGPIYRMEDRPRYTRPLNERRQKEIVRTWDPSAPDPEHGSDGQDEGGSA